MSAVERETPVIERVRLHRISKTFGYAEIRLPGVNLRGLEVQEGADGRLTLTPPEQQDAQGRRWPTYAIQPGWLEAVEREVSCLWARS